MSLLFLITFGLSQGKSLTPHSGVGTLKCWGGTTFVLCFNLHSLIQIIVQFQKVIGHPFLLVNFAGVVS